MTHVIHVLDTNAQTAELVIRWRGRSSLVYFITAL